MKTNHMTKALQIMRKHGIDAAQMQMLIAIAEKQGISQHELGETLKITPTTISRNCSRLGRGLVNGKEVGMGMIRTGSDAFDYKRTACFLTPAGAEVIKQIEGI